jgi:type I restriction enzyme, S subunit
MTELIEQELEKVLQAAAPDLKWQTYEEYRDSGAEWLGQVPKHWEVRRLRFTCKINPSKSEIASMPLDTLVSFLPMENIGEDGTISLDETRTIGQVRQGFTYFRDNDVMVAKITPCFENGKGGLCHNLLNGIGFGTTELHILRAHADRLLPLFLASIVASRPFRILGEASMHGSAGQKRVSDNFIKDFPMPLPPLSEQYAIAAFLNRETAQIDALIEKKKQMLRLLQEKRAALISQAVTRGLNVEAEMKDSGVEWLGKVPQHWEVRKLKFIASFAGGGTPSKENPDYWTGNIPWISPKDMKFPIIVDTEEHITKEAIYDSTTRVIQPWAVLIVVRSGILRHTIPVALNAVPAAINQDLKAVIPKNFLSSRYLAYLINGHQKILLMEWLKQGATVESIEFELLANTFCLIPPLVEQEAIIAYLDQQTTQIDVLISVIRKGIEKLKEKRMALISAAVTGKIDVRGELVGTEMVGEEAAD